MGGEKQVTEMHAAHGSMPLSGISNSRAFRVE